MSLATALCLVEDHNKNPFEYVCLHKQCKLPHMACAKCLVKIHKNHLNDCVELKDVQEKAKKIN